MKIPITISLEKDLWERAKQHAITAHGTSLSGLITKLLIADLGRSPEIKVVKAMPQLDSEINDKGFA